MNPGNQMDRDKYQQAWKADAAQTRVKVDADLLLQEVRCSQRHYKAAVICHDIADLVIEVLILAFWIYQGITQEPLWTWYLTVPAIIWCIGFALVRLIRRHRAPSEPGEPLLSSVKESLTLVEQQVWLARNGFRLSILPFAISILAFSAHSAWLRSKDWLDVIAHFDAVVFFVAVFYFLYCFTQFIGNRNDERHGELLKLLASLGDESAQEQLAMYSAKGNERPGKLKRLLIVACLCLVIPVLFAIAGDYIDDLRSDSAMDERSARVTHSERGVYPKRSPFAAVRWQESQPEVQVGGQWYQLVSLNDLPAAEIVAFSQKTYASTWRQRFEEDLVELLSRMGHPPGDTVKLVARSPKTSETQVWEQLPMTEANRQAIKTAADTRASKMP